MCTVSDTWTDCYSFVCATSDLVQEMWDQAQVAWGLVSLKGEVKCLVSIGTRVPSLMPLKDDVLQIGETPVTKRFRDEWALLDNMGRYYQFNMVEEIEVEEEIWLEEAKTVKAVTARSNISSRGEMLACAGSISD
jgi:hypothetical protein